MSKLFNEFWGNYGVLFDSFTKKRAAMEAWIVCKEKAIELLKAELHVPIEQKKRSFEELFKDL